MKNNSLIRNTYQQLLDTFDGGKIESLLFTSFNFSACFFENNILPLTAGCSIKEVGSLQAAQVNKVLAKTKITVVCDRSTSPEPKNNYRYGQLAVGLKDAFFHPKIILATGTLENGMPVAELIVGSCNLTLSGWGLNREVAGICKVGKQQADNLLPLIHWISNIAKKQIDSIKKDDGEVEEEGNVRKNLVAIESFLTNNCKEEISASPNFILRLPNKNRDENYLDLLTSGISQPINSCRIVSPFWSNSEHLSPLLEQLNSKHIDFVPSINHAGMHCFPSTMRDYVKDSSFSAAYQGFKNNDRYTHAKSVSLNTKDATHWFIGSANFTKAAMGNMKRGNIEAMLHYSLENKATLNADFEDLDELKINWAEDSEVEDGAPEVSSYITHAAYNWKTQSFVCVLECSDVAFKKINNSHFNQQSLTFNKQDDGTYLAKLNYGVKKPIYTIELLYLDNDETMVYQGLVSQWNAQDDELTYNPKPKLSNIMNDLRALDPVKGPKGGGGSKGSSTETGEEEDEENRVFDFFSIYQAFYKQRKYFSEHQDKDPFNSGEVFSLSLMFRAISLEVDDRKSSSGDMNKEDVIYYFIFLSEFASTAKILAANFTPEKSNDLIDKIDIALAELETPFKKLVGESQVLKQFLHTDSVDQKTVESMLGWFKEQVDFTHE
ncbi:hypothetical protein [Colwellia piezophila]|uniref:hypothetical protein n=1 Tax=Colwellia piezophila TaxID=211668 RepID=UPI000382CD7D|nr:hypothetical protein [Colwellia piezophila]